MVQTGPTWVDDEVIFLQCDSAASMTVHLQTATVLVLEHAARRCEAPHEAGEVGGGRGFVAQEPVWLGTALSRAGSSRSSAFASTKGLLFCGLAASYSLRVLSPPLDTGTT